MKPLVVLIFTFGISLVILRMTNGDWDYALAGNTSMCCMLVFTAVAHFTFTKGMILMMPQIVPYKKQLVYGTGILEILLGIGLIIPSIHREAALFLIIFFIVLLPANIVAANKRVNIEKGDFSGDGLRYLWFRIPLQILFIGWLCFFSLQ